MKGTCVGRTGGGVFGSAGLLAILSLTPALSAGPPLRYRLQVGERLVYERRVRVSRSEDQALATESTQQLQVWFLQSDRNEALVLAELVHVFGGKPGPARGVLFHLDERGRRRIGGEMLERIQGFDPVFELFPTLPPALAAGSEWLSEPDHFGRCWRCTQRGPDPAVDGAVRVEFALGDPTGVAECLGRTQRGSFWFDAQAGNVVRLECEYQDRSAGTRSQIVTRLHRRLSTEPRWCEQRVADVGRFVRTLRMESRLLERVTTEPGEVERILSKIDNLWAELLLDMPNEPQSPVRRMAEGRRVLLAGALARYRERAELVAQWLGSTAAQWSLQTPDGDTIRSEALRDRMVVECFWSADSLASLRSLEILREVQRQLPPESCRVVCLNIDADVAAGKRAIRLCGNELTHVLSGPPVGGQPPRELPVYRVLDRDSKVVGVLFGWQPLLAEKLVALGG